MPFIFQIVNICLFDVRACVRECERACVRAHLLISYSWERLTIPLRVQLIILGYRVRCSACNVFYILSEIQNAIFLYCH